MHDDELIDRAAHAMTRAEPSDQLRPAVRARLGRPGLATKARRLWIPALASAAALVVLAVTMVRMPESGSQATSPAPAVIAPPPAGVASIEPLVAEPPLVTRPAAVPPARRAVTSEAPLIAVIDPLLIDPISVPLMAVDANSGAMPMEIQPLQIEPLQSQ